MNDEIIKEIRRLVIEKSFPNNLVCFSFEIKCYGAKNIFKANDLLLEPDLSISYNVYSENLLSEDKAFNTLEEAITFMNNLETPRKPKSLKSSKDERQVIELVPKANRRL